MYRLCIGYVSVMYRLCIGYVSVILHAGREETRANGRISARDRQGLSKGEFDSVVKALGSIDDVIDTNSKDYCSIKYLLDDAKYDKLCECPKLYKTPIVRCGKKASVGYAPEKWEEFIKGVL